MKLYLSHVRDHGMSRISHQYNFARGGDPGFNLLDLCVLPFETLRNFVDDARQDRIPTFVFGSHVVEAGRLVLFPHSDGTRMTHDEVVQGALTDRICHNVSFMTD